jgi:hypothetical protein
MILWSVFSIGGDWVVNHIVPSLVCDVTLFVGVGVNIFDYPWKNSIMRLTFVTFSQCEQLCTSFAGTFSIFLENI